MIPVTRIAARGSLRAGAMASNNLALRSTAAATATPLLLSRYNSSSSKPSPESKASALIDSLPGNSLISKTGIVTVGTGLAAVAISKEIYVMNEETVILGGFLIFATLIGKMIAKPYGEWADSQIESVKNILNGSRAQHTKAVQSRIDSVEQQSDVVSHTQALFSLAKETAENEATAFELRQRTELASEVKSVLDSWVRYEGQQREEEQRLLAQTVIEKVAASLRDEKSQKQILDDAVAEVETLVKNKSL